MKLISLGLAMWLTAGISHPTLAAEQVGEAALPPTSMDRLENNPAKAAIAAREALRKEANPAKDDESAPDAGTEKALVAEPASTRLMRRIDEALRNDARTSRLGVELRVDDKGVVGLHGTVPSRQSRAAAESVASKVAAPLRIENHLVVPAK